VHANALDSITSAVFGIEPSGRVAFTSQTGENLLQQGRWLQLSGRALVPSKSLLEAAALARALRQLAAGISFKLIVTEGVTEAQAIVSGAPLALVQGTLYPTQMSSLVWLTPVAPSTDAAADRVTVAVRTMPLALHLSSVATSGESIDPNIGPNNTIDLTLPVPGTT
jgi:hypothetical protein